MLALLMQFTEPGMTQLSLRLIHLLILSLRKAQADILSYKKDWITVFMICRMVLLPNKLVV